MARRSAPMPPSRWDRRRIIVSAAVLGPATLAVLAVLVWAAVVVPDWPTRLLALGGIAFVLAIVFWLVRTARKENQAVRESMQGSPIFRVANAVRRGGTVRRSRSAGRRCSVA